MDDRPDPALSRKLPDEAATAALGRALAAALPADAGGLLILLKGELGAGKSTLARALLRALGHEGPVPSPTYTLVEPYELETLSVFHVDLYRVASPDELEYLGWDELSDGLLLVEWPERAPALFDSADLVVSLTYDGAGRRATLAPGSERGAALLAALAAGDEAAELVP